MTTNNHPANGPVSLERLHQIRETLSKAAAQSDGGNIGYAMADAVKVIDGAIASFGTEPVAWLLSGGGAKNHVSFDSGNAYADPLREVTPLYTASPAPISVPAAMEMDDDFDSSFEHGKAVGWNAYRAAMLQGADGALTDEDAKRVDELVMWIKRLAHSLRKANPDSKLQSDAMDYLSRKGLIGVEDILR
ncbi:hypothetical protein [Enterobacter cloacae]|uniref:hypothetical protein n=1 Tax=Enterobacter cloacae TaxID=550 RepID=UPI002550339F|nr:hypothetical protein [Enterobacter cloacae]MDK9961761.1 hypothetical protein [Enterobacter cloacae]